MFFRSFTKSAMWYGVLPGGACGFFDPNNTQPYVNTEVRIRIRIQGGLKSLISNNISSCFCDNIIY